MSTVGHRQITEGVGISYKERMVNTVAPINLLKIKDLFSWPGNC